MWRLLLTYLVLSTAFVKSDTNSSRGECGVSSIVASSGSLVVMKLPETGSTWFAALLARAHPELGFRHQLFKGRFEPSSVSHDTLIKARSAWLNLAFRCPVRNNYCYHGAWSSSEAVLHHCVSEHDRYDSSCVGTTARVAKVRGFSMNPVDVREAAATSRIMCQEAIYLPFRDRLLVVLYRANIIKSATSQLVKKQLHDISKNCTRCGQHRKDDPACRLVSPLISPTKLLESARRKLNHTVALFGLAAVACWPVEVVAYEALQLDSHGVLDTIIDRIGLSNNTNGHKKSGAGAPFTIAAQVHSGVEDLRVRIGNFDEVSAYLEANASPCLNSMLHSTRVDPSLMLLCANHTHLSPPALSLLLKSAIREDGL